MSSIQHFIQQSGEEFERHFESKVQAHGRHCPQFPIQDIKSFHLSQLNALVEIFRNKLIETRERWKKGTSRGDSNIATLNYLIGCLSDKK